MTRSTNRILTTHAGRLDGSAELIQMSREIMGGRKVDPKEIQTQLRGGLNHVVRKQAEAGVDVISDGEITKFGFGSLAYYGRRLSGLATRPLIPGEAPFMAMQTNERIEFAEFYREMQFLPAPTERVICNGPVEYIGQEEIKRDIELFKSTLAETGDRKSTRLNSSHVSESRMPSF